MNTRKELDMLCRDSVSVKTESYTVIDGVEYILGKPSRTAYLNSEYGRERLTEEVGEPYYSAVMAIWGQTPTVTESAPPLLTAEEDV